MKEFIYKQVGYWLFLWYGALRWTWFNDEKIFWWAYKPINLATAFLSIIFLTLVLTIPNYYNKFLCSIAIFLSFRNFYYTIEDIIDFGYNPIQQVFFIIVDIVMVIYCLMYIKKYRDLL